MIRALIVFLVLLCSYSSTSEELYFPQITSKNLNKDTFIVPDSLDKAFNIFIISFDRDMQIEADKWFSDLAILNNSKPIIDIFNTPVIPDPGRFVRGFINRGFKSIYKNKSMRDRVIIMYVKKDGFYVQGHFPAEQQH